MINENNIQKHYIWAFTICVVAIMLCLTVIYCYGHPYVFRIEMDNNTRDAFHSVNWSVVNSAQHTNYSENITSNYFNYIRSGDNINLTNINKNISEHNYTIRR